MNKTFLRIISPFPFDRPPEIIETDLAEIKDSARKHNLLMLVLSRLKNMKGSFAGNADVERFIEEERMSYLSAVSVSMRQEAEEKRILDTLKNADVPALVIKGNALASEIYGDSICRSSCDSDILIRKNDAFTADRIILSLGYVHYSNSPLEYSIHKLHHEQYHRKDGFGIVELHWNFAMPFFFNQTSEEIWGDVRSTGQGGYRLSPEMTVILLLSHHHMHSFRELRILVDILWTMHKYDDIIDWKSFTVRMKEIGLLKAAYITLSQMNSLWKDDLEQLLSIRILSGELSKSIRKPILLLWYFSGEKMGADEIYRDRLVGRFSLDKWANITGSVIRTLFPLPAAIKGLYNDRSVIKLPYNYGRYLCWRIKDWTGN